MYTHIYTYLLMEFLELTKYFLTSVDGLKGGIISESTSPQPLHLLRRFWCWNNELFKTSKPVFTAPLQLP